MWPSTWNKMWFFLSKLLRNSFVKEMASNFYHYIQQKLSANIYHNHKIIMFPDDMYYIVGKHDNFVRKTYQLVRTTYYHVYTTCVHDIIYKCSSCSTLIQVLPMRLLMWHIYSFLFFKDIFCILIIFYVFVYGGIFFSWFFEN